MVWPTIKLTGGVRRQMFLAQIADFPVYSYGLLAAMEREPKMASVAP
jgi:hypothetical protein